MARRVLRQGLLHSENTCLYLDATSCGIGRRFALDRSFSFEWLTKKYSALFVDKAAFSTPSAEVSISMHRSLSNVEQK